MLNTAAIFLFLVPFPANTNHINILVLLIFHRMHSNGFLRVLSQLAIKSPRLYYFMPSYIFSWLMRPHRLTLHKLKFSDRPAATERMNLLKRLSCIFNIKLQNGSIWRFYPFRRFAYKNRANITYTNLNL